jgi:transposase-like protein
MSKIMTVEEFASLFPNDDACLDHLFQRRFGHLTHCPKCSKETTFYRLPKDPAYSCKWCGHHLHPMVGTPFAKSHTSLWRWYYAIYLFTNTRHGVSAKELQRKFGCSYKTAWRMGHEIRKYMAALDRQGPLSGNVEADESYLGGRDKLGRRGRSKANKAIVFGMVSRETGEVITKVVQNVQAVTLIPEIKRNVLLNAIVHTDEHGGYQNLGREGYRHQTVRHVGGEYAKPDGTHINQIEGYFGLLKRSILSTHIHVSHKYLPLYLGEFEWRYNLRKVPSEMFPRMVLFPRSSLQAKT